MKLLCPYTDSVPVKPLAHRKPDMYLSRAKAFSKDDYHPISEWPLSNLCTATTLIYLSEICYLFRVIMKSFPVEFTKCFELCELFAVDISHIWLVTKQLHEKFPTVCTTLVKITTIGMYA